jgi:DNA polymerase-3 subunit gamma/tau
MSYQVTARKWRPMVFDDVVGQTHVTNTLRNAIASNRVAHAYIFSGTRGCGKTTTARIFARSLNCLHPVDSNPDNTCEICTEIIDGRNLDIIEIDGASNNGVEEVRNLRESLRYTPTRGNYKVYIIDEVHMLSNAAFNALLKTLEEPPAHVIFILATTEVHKMPMTILSRCQRFDFRRISIDEIIARLTLISTEEKVTIEPEALAIIARRADGSMRDSQSIFDQVRSFCGSDIKTSDLLKAFNVVDQELLFRFTDLFKTHDAGGAIELVDTLMKGGYNLREFIGGLIEHLRNILVVRSTGSARLVEVSEVYRHRYETESPTFAEADILRLIKQAAELDQILRFAPQPRYRVEASLVQMVRMENAVQLQSLLQQLDELKKKLHEQRVSVPPPTPFAGSPVRSEVRVTGEVNAGYLKSAAAIRFSASSRTPFPDTAAVETKIDAAILPLPSAAKDASLLTYETVVLRWGEFVDLVKKTRISVGSALQVSRLLDARNGTVRVACPDDYHQSMIHRDREYLSSALEQFFGGRAFIAAVTPGDPVPRMETRMAEPRSEDAAPSAQPQTAPSNVDEHPLIGILKREFGAEKLQRPDSY